jgi:phenylacetate-CoA ligase
VGKIGNTISLIGHLVKVLALDGVMRDPARLRRYQEGRLRALVDYAYARVPLYRRRFDAAGVRPESIRGLDDLGRIPILSKRELREAPRREILADGLHSEDCFLVETSGSTGEPTDLYKDRNALLSLGAWTSPMNISRWVGRPAWRLMTLLVRHERTLEAGLVRSLPRFLLRVTEGDALAPPDVQLDLLNRARPQLLITYPSVLRTLAVLVKERKPPVHQPAAIALSAEVFDAPTRRLAGEVFTTSTFVNAYGCTEAGLVALECHQHRGLHVTGTRAIVEVLRDGRPAAPGDPGEVVVTDLTNFASPILRYAGLGDVAVWSPARCPCGRVLPLLELIEGRRVDAFLLPDGRIVHPYHLTLAMEHIDGIHRYQIVQEARDRVRVLVVGPAGNGVGTRRAAADALGAILGAQVQVVVDGVEVIPTAPGEAAPRTVRSLVPR